MARKTRDFSDPHKLGFMRFLEVIFTLNITLRVLTLVILHKGYWDLSFDSWLSILDLLFEAVTIWLIWRRKQYTRQIVIGFAAFNIAVGTAYNIATGVFDPLWQLWLIAWDLVLIAYFATSRRAKAVLVQPFSVESAQAEVRREKGLYQLKTFAFWRNMVIFYCVFSVVGHWMEAALCTLIKLGIVQGTYDPTSQIWSDYLYPFPVYGVGFCACVLLLFPVKSWLQRRLGGTVKPLVCSLLFNTLVCAAIELALGLATNQPGPDGKLPLWDYSDMPFNFMGQICLQNTSAFGIIATLMTWVVYPALEGLIARVPRDTMNIVFVAIIVGYLILSALYYVNIVVPGLEEAAASAEAEIAAGSSAVP